MSPDRIAGRVEDLLAHARQAAAAGHGTEAIALAGAALSLDPSNVEAAELLGGIDHRCQMTLMFCDLVGSTALADRIDPEEFSEILREYRSTCTEVIERFGGFIEDRKGDGLLVRFGYPWVHEDDARRAVLSGLEIVRAIGALDRDLHLRISVHTGLIVLDGGEVVGAAPNEAARMQTFAEPDTVVISDTTHALVSEYFDLRPLGPADLRGVSRPVELYTVVGERESTAMDARAPATPFINRRSEQAVIGELWRAASAGAPAEHRALLVTAPAGMGKSRLVRECARTLGARLLVCRCSSYHGTTSLHPFQRLLQQICDVSADDDAARRLAKLRARVGEGEAGGAPGQDLPVLADALAIPAEAISPPSDVDASKLRAIALATAAQLIRSTAAQEPVLLLVDDLHWADESTLDLLSALLAEPCPGMLLVLAARPTFVAPWPADLVRPLVLDPLPAADLGEMLRGMQEGSALQEERRHELIALSDGVPLFLEELVRSGSAVGGEAAAGSGLQVRGSRVPAALRDPLLSRLVLPGVDLQLAQIAATIGRDVDRELLQRACALPDQPFQAKLANLIAAGLLDACPDATIRFRHELIREVAYETQRLSARRACHSRIADLLREGSVGRSGDAGELAFHLEHAQRIPEAIEAHLDAARIHQSLGAHKEAMSKLTHVLELVEQLPRGAPRLIGELTARQLRSFSAVLTGGYSAPETSEDHGRCVELCEHLGLTPELLPSLLVSWSYYCAHGDLAETERVCTAIDRVIDDSGLALPASELARGLLSFFLGRFDEAHALMHAFVSHPWAQWTEGPPEGWPLPNDPLAAMTGHLVFTTWMRGEHAAADALAEQVLRRLAQLEFPYGPFTTGYATSQLAIIRRLEGDHAGTARLAGEMIELGERHGFVLWTLTGQIQHLISQVHMGATAALAPLEEAVGYWRGLLSIEVYAPYWLTELATAQAAAGRPDRARASLDEALRVAALTQSEFYSAETLRIRGLLRCEQGDPDGGVADIHAALSLARRQRADAFELRATEALRLAGDRSLPAQ